MRAKAIEIMVFALAAAFIWGCLPAGEEKGEEKSYARRLKEARDLTSRAEELYHESMALGPGPEHNAKLRRAYDTASEAMDILNKLEDDFGDREVPPDEVLAHKPLMRKLSRLRSDMVRVMPVGD